MALCFPKRQNTVITWAVSGGKRMEKCMRKAQAGGNRGLIELPMIGEVQLNSSKKHWAGNILIIHTPKSFHQGPQTACTALLPWHSLPLGTLIVVLPECVQWPPAAGGSPGQCRAGKFRQWEACHLHPLEGRVCLILDGHMSKLLVFEIG